MHEDELEAALKFIEEIRKERDREKWVRRRCIAIGLALAEVLRQLVSWAVENIKPLHAAFQAFFDTKGGI